MRPVEAIVVFVLAAWLLASVGYQIFMAQWERTARRWDVFHWLPAYRFFSGTPRDFRLLCRDRLTSGETGEWCELSLSRRRQWLDALWNPRETALGAIASLVDDLIRISGQGDRRKGQQRIAERFVYRSVLRFVLAQPHAAEARARQFRIDEISYSGVASSAVTVFSSEYHAL
jgi:hypothetical protein